MASRTAHIPRFWISDAAPHPVYIRIMTQQALAEQVGVSRQTVIAIEQGRHSPSLEVALKIAQAFDKPVERVFWLLDNGQLQVTRS